MVEKRSKFMELPTDVRLYIFDYYFLNARPPQAGDPIALKNSRSIRVRHHKYWNREHHKCEDRRHHDWFGSEEMTRLLRVNKTICAEATALIYSTFTFEFIHTAIANYTLIPVLDKIGSRQRAMIRSIRAIVHVSAPLPAGQIKALEYLRDTLPNLNKIEFLPFLNLFSIGRPVLAPAEQTMRLFEYFPNAVSWNVQHLLEFEPENQTRLVVQYVPIPLTERDSLQQQLKKRNMQKVAMQRP